MLFEIRAQNHGSYGQRSSTFTGIHVSPLLEFQIWESFHKVHQIPLHSKIVQVGLRYMYLQISAYSVNEVPLFESGGIGVNPTFIIDRDVWDRGQEKRWRPNKTSKLENKRTQWEACEPTPGWIITSTSFCSDKRNVFSKNTQKPTTKIRRKKSNATCSQWDCNIMHVKLNMRSQLRLTNWQVNWGPEAKFFNSNKAQNV